MKSITFFYLFMMVLFLACSKTETKPKSYEYWNNLVNEKREEIFSLVQSVPCTVIDEYEIIKKDSYFLVHPSIKAGFDNLQGELEKLEVERNAASVREGWIGDLPRTIPSHPVRKICDNGKPKLIYVKDLSMEEISAELPVRYNEINNFYKDEVCSDVTQWIGRYIFSDCGIEPIPVHKTIRNEEMVSKIDIYNQMMVMKILHEKQSCDVKIRFEKVFETKSVICKDGKPVVIIE